MSPSGTPDEGRAGETSTPASGTESDEDALPEEPPLTDPAHRAARWFMMLAPVLMGLIVLLLLRLSTR